MALFKIMRGSSSRLESVEFHDGYAYYCTDDGSFYIDAVVSGENKRTKINPKTSMISATLTSSGWSNGSQTISVSGLASDSNGIIDLASTATAAQRTAAEDAQLTISSQSAGSLTITANGTVPSVDIPVAVILIP